MEQLLNPPPQMDSAAADTLRDDIVKLLHDKKLTVEQLKAPFLFDWGSVAQYNGASLKTVLTAAKNNVVNICNQVTSALEKVDLGNRGNVNTFLLAVAIRNAPGKSANSKNASLGLDGILSVYTIFEDSLNCANYLERKVVTALNDFRPPVGMAAPAKIEIAAPAPAPVEEPVVEAEAPAVVEVKGLDLSIPNFPDPAHDALKKDILKVLDGQKVKLDPNYVAGNVMVPIVLDWTSISSYTGSTLGAVLRAIKNGIANICAQVGTAYEKASRDRLPTTSQFLTLVVIQNIPGKSANDKKASLHVEGHLLVNTIFEDSMNCTYYIEKKVVLALDDFRAPPGISPPPRPQSVPTYVAPPAAAAPASPAASASAPAKPATTTTTTTTTTSTATTAKPAAPAPAATPAPAPAPAKPAPDAKPKGRPEFEGLPYVEEPQIQHLMREIQAMARSQNIVVEHKGAPIGAPICIDWASILVYSGAKQSTVIRNVHTNVLRLSRDIVHSIKLACTDPNVKPSVATYLRSVTIRNVPGSATNAKKVSYEDGHMVLETAFEDASNCALYFESKITQELGARAKGTAPPKPEAEEMVKEEINAKITAHYDKDYKKIIPPGTAITVDYSTMAKSFPELGPNAAASVTQIMQDLVAVITTLKEKDNEEIRNELKRITISHVNAHATDDKKKVDYLDDGNLLIISTFDDKVASGQGWRDKFVKGLAIILKKIHIRDHLMPQYTKHVSEEAKQTAQVNPWIPIKAYPTENPVITVLFDWKVLHHFTHTQDFVIDNLDKIIKNLESPFIEGMLTSTFHDVCNYDVGKHAVQSFVKTIILRDTLKAKDEKFHYKPEDGVLMFETTFHNPTETKTRNTDLIKHMKEQLRVAHPCAVQDAYHHIVKINADIASQVGKPGLPLIIDWNSFVPVPNFQSKFEGYTKIHKLTVDLVRGGLAQGPMSMAALAQDPIVKDAIAKKLDKIIIRVDTNDTVKSSPGRPGDPKVKAEWEDKTTLVFTQNAATGFETSPNCPGWGYVMELALDTRPPKVQRAIANNKANTQKLATQLQTLLGFPIAVDVDYENFIRAPEYALYLDEKPYHNVIDNAAYHVAATILGADALGGLKTYKTVVPLIKDRLSSIVIKVSPQDKVNQGGTLTYAGKTLTINLNLSDLVREGFEKGKYTNWRIPLEALLNLRDTKVQEEIADRVNVLNEQKKINTTIGGNATLKVKWDTIIAAPAFVANKDNYVDWLHSVGERIGNRLANNEGFGRLCEYEEVRKHIASILKGIEITADSGSSARTPWGFSFNQGTGILVMSISVGEIHGQVGAFDFYNWGYLIERALGIRHMIIQGTIDRNKKVLDAVATQLGASVQNRVKVIVDWDITKTPTFDAVQDYKPVIDYIAKTTEEWLPIDAIIRDNHELLAEIKDNINSFILKIDPSSAVNESQHIANEYGVDYAQVKYQNPATKDVLVGTVNWSAITGKHARDMELELKVELLLTPAFAKDRLREKKNRIHEANVEANQEAMMREQRRQTSAMSDQAHEMRRLNNYFRR